MLGRMRRTSASRLLATLVGALFLGGIGGTSDLDALLFHSGTAPATRTHYEPAGPTTHHADHCLLTLRVAAGRSSAPVATALRFEGIPEHLPAPRLTTVPRSFLPGLHEDSRAPPAALA